MGMVQMNVVLDRVLAIAIVLTFIFLIYTKLKNQSFKDTMKEIKELIGGENG